jgi:hypothetical protein
MIGERTASSTARPLLALAKGQPPCVFNPGVREPNALQVFFGELHAGRDIRRCNSNQHCLVGQSLQDISRREGLCEIR